MRIDPVIDGFLNATFSERPDVTNPPDPMQTFLENAELAGRVGWNRVERLHAETAGVDTRSAQIMGKPESRKVKAASEWDEPVADAAVLAKRRLDGLDGYRQWFRKGIEGGRTASAILEV